MSRQLPPLGCAALVFACLAAPAFAAEVTYGVAVRTDVRTRTPLPGDRGEYVTGDLELNPRGEVTLGVDTSTFFVGYLPSLLWREPQVEGGRLLALHRARLAFGSRWQRVTMLLSQDGAYGEADLRSLRLPDETQAPSVDEVQTLNVSFVRSLTLLNVEANPLDRFTLGFSAGYSLSGSPEDSVALPLQYGPLASVRARVALTRTDGLSTTAQFSQSTFVTGQEQLIAQLFETWDRQLSRTLQLNLGAGVALTREELIALRGIVPGSYLDVLPVALATLSWRDVLQGHPLRLDSSLRMAPFADRFTANVYERVEARVAGEWRPGREWITTAAVGGAVAVPLGFSLQAPEGATTEDNLRIAQSGDRLIFTEATVAWSVKTWLLLQASARVSWTEQPRLGNPGQMQAVGTLSVTVLEQGSVAW